MVDYKQVANIFNDFMGVYTGKNPIGIRELCQRYEENSLFMAMIGNLDEAAKLPVTSFLYDVYGLLKPYRSRMLKDSEWAKIVADVEMLNKKYKNNVWSRQIILEFLDLLERDHKELSEMEEDEQAPDAA